MQYHAKKGYPTSEIAFYYALRITHYALCIEHEFSVLIITGDRAVRLDLAVEQLLGQDVLDLALNGSAQRTGAVAVVKALVGDGGDRRVGKGDGDVHGGKTLGEGLCRRSA